MKLVCGFGINDVKGSSCYIDENGVEKKTPSYTKWREMIRRCYDEKTHKKYPTYIGCTVSDEWEDFSKFKEWYESHVKENDLNYHLDKDLLILGNKVYSPDRCVLIPRQINSLITKRDACRGQYPIGVHFHSRDHKFESKCRYYDLNNGKSIKKFLGYYTTPEDAANAYVEYKSEVIRNVIPTVDQYSLSDEMKDRIRKGLQLQIQLLQEGSYG
jgi:hypothetical protein